MIQSSVSLVSVCLLLNLTEFKKEKNNLPLSHLFPLLLIFSFRPEL